MASIRKRSWKSGGEIKTAWICDYADQAGARRLKTFKTKKEADAWLVQARHQVASGTHTADSASITVAEAAELWLARCERDGLEQSTMVGYRSHVTYHIGPILGSAKLSRLTAPRVQEFVDQLLAGGRSRALTKKIVSSLSSIISEAQSLGLTAVNPVREARRVRLPKREHGKPVKPEENELRAMMAGMQDDRWRPLLTTILFTGLRGSEARGLKWSDVDLKAGILSVRERVDRWGQFGSPKSAAGTREIPLGPFVVNTLKTWRLVCPKGDLDLVFPNGAGKVESHANILRRGFHPLQVAAGIVDQEGRPKYSLHALRHAAAALFIDARDENGNPWITPKRLQAIMGHESIQMTYDLYGYLFDDRDKERDLMQRHAARLFAVS